MGSSMWNCCKPVEGIPMMEITRQVHLQSMSLITTVRQNCNNKKWLNFHLFAVEVFLIHGFLLSVHPWVWSRISDIVLDPSTLTTLFKSLNLNLNSSLSGSFICISGYIAVVGKRQWAIEKQRSNRHVKLILLEEHLTILLCNFTGPPHCCVLSPTTRCQCYSTVGLEEAICQTWCVMLTNTWCYLVCSALNGSCSGFSPPSMILMDGEVSAPPSAPPSVPTLCTVLLWNLDQVSLVSPVLLTHSDWLSASGTPALQAGLLLCYQLTTVNSWRLEQNTSNIQGLNIMCLSSLHSYSSCLHSWLYLLNQKCI